MSGSIPTRLQDSLRQLHLPTFRDNCHAQAVLAEREGTSFAQYLLHLCEMELTDRRERRIQRRRAVSKLPLGKTLSAFDRGRLPKSVDRQLASLVEGDFLDRRENVLLFGPPGSGKTHLMCALGHELVLQDRRRVLQLLRLAGAAPAASQIGSVVGKRAEATSSVRGLAHR